MIKKITILCGVLLISQSVHSAQGQEGLELFARALDEGFNTLQTICPADNVIWKKRVLMYCNLKNNINSKN